MEDLVDVCFLLGEGHLGFDLIADGAEEIRLDQRVNDAVKVATDPETLVLVTGVFPCV